MLDRLEGGSEGLVNIAEDRPVACQVYGKCEHGPLRLSRRKPPDSAEQRHSTKTVTEVIENVDNTGNRPARAGPPAIINVQSRKSGDKVGQKKGVSKSPPTDIPPVHDHQDERYKSDEEPVQPHEVVKCSGVEEIVFVHDPIRRFFKMNCVLRFRTHSSGCPSGSYPVG